MMNRKSGFAVASTPTAFASCAMRITSAGYISIFDGMQPLFRQVPPEGSAFHKGYFKAFRDCGTHHVFPGTCADHDDVELLHAGPIL